jgi:hypothetical protein
MLKELFKRLHRLVKTYLNHSFGRYSFFLCHDITFSGIPGWSQRLLPLFPVVFDVFKRNGNIVVLFLVAAAEGFDCVFFVKPAKQVNLSAAGRAKRERVGFGFQKLLSANRTGKLRGVGHGKRI